jgi:uncharacterized delta-60 repeat protein
MLKASSFTFLVALFFSISVSKAQAGPGDLDPTFGVDGRVISPNLGADSVAIQPDGKIVTAGSLGYGSIVVARFTPDGALDPTFDGDGKAFASAEGYQCTIALAPNGKIVVAVSDKTGRVDPPITFVLLRFNSNGSLDTTFGGNGVTTPSFNGYPNASAYNVAVQADGKIVAVGFVRTSLAFYKSAVARFNDDGGIDTSFSGDGLAVGPDVDANNFESAVAIRPDGKIVAAGYAFGGAGFKFTVSRYNTDGSPDVSFNDPGSTVAGFSDYGQVNDIAIQPDGKIVLAGYNVHDFALVRFNSDGLLDNGFGSNGKVITAFGGYDHTANAVAIQSDGKIVAGGGHYLFDEATWGTYFFGIDLARYNSDGSLDTSFGVGGKVSNSLGDGYFANDVAIQADGKIVAAGNNYDAGSLVLVRYNGTTNARFDFDGDGKSDLSVFRPNEGNWYVSKSGGGVMAQNWGVASDVLAPADYDGDGKADVAVWRPLEGNWYFIRSSDSTVSLASWGVNGDIPVAADYDNDGRTDMAVFRPSDGNWYIIGTTSGVQVINWGIGSDRQVPADYDGDGKTDVAVFRPSDGNWYIIGSTSGVQVVNWGIGSDRQVPADYDGDGKADVAVFRPSDGNWYIIGSTSGLQVVNWGIGSDITVPGDYDGDGKSDVAVFRTSDGNWYIIGTTSGVQVINWGTNGDVPIPAKYIP